MTRVASLGHVIFGDEISVDLAKNEVVINWPRPITVTEIGIFLGSAEYYRRFVEEVSALVSLLTRLLKKKEKFVWAGKCVCSFQELKQKLTIPYGPRGHKIYNDASFRGLG